MFIDPIAFQIGPVSIHWYGIIFAVSALVAGWLAVREARHRGEDGDQVWNLILVGAIGGLIGARLYHVVHEWAYYSEHLDQIVQVWVGGIGIPGGIAGGVGAIFLYSRTSKLNFARWLDIGAPALLLAQAIGRLGNWVNQELYGPPTDLPWGIPIQDVHRIPPYHDLDTYPIDTTRFHPLFAYESILNLVGMALLLWIGRRYARRLYDGDIAMLYLVWYGSMRTVLETFRTGNWLIGDVPTAMILGIGFAIFGAVVIIVRHARGSGVPGAYLAEMEARQADGAEGAKPTTEAQAG